jgi:hypothetical protein
MPVSRCHESAITKSSCILPEGIEPTASYMRVSSAADVTVRRRLYLAYWAFCARQARALNGYACGLVRIRSPTNYVAITRK